MAGPTLQEALGWVDEIAKELSFYDAGTYKQNQEQTKIQKCRELLEKVKTAVMARDPDGITRGDKLSADQWRKFAMLTAPLARCFTTQSLSVLSTAKTRYSSALAVATLALISSCNQKSKVIVSSALESGVVDAIVSALKASLRNQVSDRVVKAMLYKLIEALFGFTLYANTQHQQDMVARDVVNVCLDLLTTPTVEMESRINASKTLFNCLNNSNGRSVTELRSSKITALNQLLQQLMANMPDPVTAAAQALTPPTSANKAISMPVMLPAIMSWIWFLPHHILDQLVESLADTLNRLVVLVWPEGCAGLPLLPDPSAPSYGSGREEVQGAGPLQVAQLALPNRSLQKTLQNLFRAIASGLADPRLVSMLRGKKLPAAAAAGGPAAADADDAYDTYGGDFSDGDTVGSVDTRLRSTSLPARLVRVVREGRPDGPETKVALELLDELFECDADGQQPELADDALDSGLLGAMTEMGVLHSLHTEAGLAGVAAYIRLTLKLIKRAPYTLNLDTRLYDSGVPASVAYVAFWPTNRVSLKVEALQTLAALVRVNTAMTERVVAMINFPTALTNTLLGGDPEVKKPPKRNVVSKKKGASGAAAAAMAADSAAVDNSGSSPSGSSRSHREQMQEAAFDILTAVLDVAGESDEVWETVVESGMLIRLVQYSTAFPMQPTLLAELLLSVALTFRDHREAVAVVAPLQAACGPHLLPLLLHEEPVVVAAAARVLRDIVEDMARYRSDSADVAEGDDILKALVAAGPAIDTADVAAAKVAAAAVAGANEGEPRVSPGNAPCQQKQVGAGQGSAAAAGSPGAAGAESQRGSVTKVEMKMELDAPSTLLTSTFQTVPAATMTPPVPAVEAEAGTAFASAGSTSATTAAPITAHRTESGAGAAEAGPLPQSVLPELVDVTAHGLGLICAAIQSCIAGVLQRPASPAQQSSLTGAAASGAVAVVTSAALSPAAAGAGNESDKGQAGATTATTVPSATSLHLEGPTYDALDSLLVSCRLLAEACLQMPPHGSVRRHMARAFAYARPAAGELAEALGAVPEPVEPALKLLLSSARSVAQVLRKIPVLDVALLPKKKQPPKPVALVELRRSAAPAPYVISKRGRAAGAGTSQQQQSNKRLRTDSAAALAGEATAAGAASTGAGGLHTMTRTRSSTLAANGNAYATAVAVATGTTIDSPNSSALHSAGTSPSAPAAVHNNATHRAAVATPAERAADISAADAMVVANRTGAMAESDQQLPPGWSTRPNLGIDLAKSSGGGMTEDAGWMKDLEVAALVDAAADDKRLAAVGSGSLKLLEPALPRLLAAPRLEGAAVDHAQINVQSESPSPSREACTFRGAHGATSCTTAATVTATAMEAAAAQAVAAMAAADVKLDLQAAGGAIGSGSGGGTDGGCVKGRAAEFRVKYLDMKVQTGRMAEELEELRRVKEISDTQQRKVNASLATRTKELCTVRKEVEALRQQLTALTSELRAAQSTNHSLQEALMRAAEQRRQLREENAELRAELANLADLD